MKPPAQSTDTDEDSGDEEGQEKLQIVKFFVKFILIFQLIDNLISQQLCSNAEITLLNSDKIGVVDVSDSVIDPLRPTHLLGGNSMFGFHLQ